MAKKDVSAIVSGAGLLASIFTDLVEAVRERGGGDEDIHRLATPQGRELIGKLADLIVGAGKSAYAVTVNYRQSLADMIAAGRYDWKNDNINDQNFSTCGRGTDDVTIELIHFDRVMASDDVLAELDQRGLRPAELPELLAFGAKYPDAQRQFPIVALGSVWRGRVGDRVVAVLWGVSRRRHLGLDPFGGEWCAHYRFAAVRK